VLPFLTLRTFMNSNWQSLGVRTHGEAREIFSLATLNIDGSSNRAKGLCAIGTELHFLLLHVDTIIN
jgi:hypothetical protein